MCQIFLNLTFVGMVERCNHSIEDIVHKAMIGESDWCPMLPSVLFALQTLVHSSTGFTPFCMLYNFDPVLQFEYADKLHNGLISDDDDEVECDDQTSADCECSGTTQSDPLLSKIQFMEDQRKGIFDKASESFKKKPQKHQAKGYNNRQNKGKPFEIGDKCLKWNQKDDSCKAKLHQKYLGPHTMVGKSGANAYFLMDHTATN